MKFITVTVTDSLGHPTSVNISAIETIKEIRYSFNGEYINPSAIFMKSGQRVTCTASREEVLKLIADACSK